MHDVLLTWARTESLTRPLDGKRKQLAQALFGAAEQYATADSRGTVNLWNCASWKRS